MTDSNESSRCPISHPQSWWIRDQNRSDDPVYGAHGFRNCKEEKQLSSFLKRVRSGFTEWEEHPIEVEIWVAFKANRSCLNPQSPGLAATKGAEGAIEVRPPAAGELLPNNQGWSCSGPVLLLVH